MTQEFKPYPEYKDSEQAWLGNIPEHWECVPHRAVFQEIKKQGYTEEPLLSVTISKGILKQKDLLANSSKKDSSNLDKAKYKLVDPGDIAYNKMRAWQGAIGVSKYRGIVSPAYIVVRLRQDDNSDYFHYLFRTPAFAKEAERWSYGITSDMWSLRPEHFKMIYSCMPPKTEQDSIVLFLRSFEQKVARFIRNRQKLIKVLNEQKQAIINKVVTRGLDPNVKMKASGVEWVGEIPEHWRVVPLRWYISISSGTFLDGNKITDNKNIPHLFPVIGGNGILGYANHYNSESATIVIGRVGALCGNVHLITENAWITDNALRVNNIRCFDIEYLSFQMRAMNLNVLANANAQPLITGSVVKKQKVVLPTIDEQKNIVIKIKKISQYFEKAVHTARKEIDLIKEYRTRLITDVVTGKIDVRELAKNIDLDADVEELQEEPIIDEEIVEADDLIDEEVAVANN
ncbi:MAG: restriction endonuclease subunit S [Pseudomonadota bacterium]